MSDEKKILQLIYKDAKLHNKRAIYVSKGNVVMVDDVMHEVAKIQQTTTSISDYITLLYPRNLKISGIKIGLPKWQPAAILKKKYKKKLCIDLKWREM